MTLHRIIAQVSDTYGVSHADVVAACERAVKAAAEDVFGDACAFEATYSEEVGDVELHAFFVVREVVDNPNREVSAKGIAACDTYAEIDEEVGFQVFYRPEDKDRARAQDEQFGAILGFTQWRAEFGRIAIHAAKQAVIETLRTAERERIVEAYAPLVGSCVLGVVLSTVRGEAVKVSLGGGVVGHLARKDQHTRDNLSPGEQVVCVVSEVSRDPEAPAVRLSRACTEFVGSLVSWAVPAVASGEVIIAKIARIAGQRSKVLVRGKWDDVDPVAECVGERGSRVREITEGLIGERVEFIEVCDENPIHTAMDALGVGCDTAEMLEDGTLLLVVDEQEVGLAIGPRGVNRALVEQLTGCSVRIVSKHEWESTCA